MEWRELAHKYASGAWGLINNIILANIHPKQVPPHFTKKTSTIQYGHRKCETSTLTFSQTLGNENSKNEIRKRQRKKVTREEWIWKEVKLTTTKKKISLRMGSKIRKNWHPINNQYPMVFYTQVQYVTHLNKICLFKCLV